MILIKERIGKILENLQEMINPLTKKIESYKMIQTGERFSDIAGLKYDAWDNLDNNQIWGGDHEYFWFATDITIPDSYQGKCVVYELKTGKEGLWDATNPQFLAYVNGKIKQGMDVNHREIILTESAQAGEVFHLVLSAFTGDSNFNLQMDSCIKVLDRKIEKYYYDLAVPYEVARLLQKDSNEYIEIIGELNESLNLLDTREIYSFDFYKSLDLAQNYITEQFYNKYCGKEKQTVCCVGHTHIDVAWMWTLGVTKDKAVRSFSTVIEFMKEYPEYIFMSSQPQLYLYVKKLAPEIYEQIKGRIQEGRWEPEGAMFVEADCNLASGESFIRQILYGKKFFKEEFGKDCKVLWLPDVFGYSAALPQIMKKCGIDYFMTTKISWNEFNKMPYDTFLWEGIDGTSVLTHFAPARDYGAKAIEGSTETEHFTTYNGMLNPSQIKGSWQRYSQKELNNEVLMSYGYGDGGGGPTRKMLEFQRRLSKGIPGCPNTKQSTALSFFRKLEKDVAGHKYLPKWVGELYLEYHRGTYTSMARNKKYNRRAEFQMLNTEFMRTLSEIKLGMSYPAKELSKDWERLMRNQFHDILPGSSIKEVYTESKEEYGQIFKSTDSMLMEAANNMAQKVLGEEGSLVIFNPNSFMMSDIVEFSGENWKDSHNAIMWEKNFYPVQRLANGHCISYVENVPSKGYKTFLPEQHMVEKQNIIITEHYVETPYLIVELNNKGCFTRIYDKQNKREIIPAGKAANEIISYEDRPHNFDAWDINHYYREKSWPVDQVESIEIEEKGPVRYALKITKKYLESVIIQHIYFYENQVRIDIKNEIDWKQKQILLRNYFPLDLNTAEATYEIQYGNVKRATHYNTSWDFAKFEVCAHKWLDVSEDDYGVSVLNDCKYGYSVHDSVVGLTMLKSAVYPNPDADKEKHEFTYSIVLHKGGWRQAETVQKAYGLNNPFLCIQKKKQGGSMPPEFSFVKVDVPNVIVEAIKKSETGNEIILRMYECYNRRTSTTLTFDGSISEAAETDMLEQKLQEMKVTDMHKICFEIKPYEIKTIKVRWEDCNG